MPRTDAGHGWRDVDLPWLHGGDLVAQQLRAEGVDTLFVLTGGHISPILDGAFYQGLGIVDFRHEQAAAHAADAYARLTRKPAVAVVTAGPGFTCALTGLANAFYSQSPLVLLAGRNPLATDGAGNLQDAPQVEMARPVTKLAQTVYSTDRITSVLSQAFAVARAPRMGPVMVDFPIETLLARIDNNDYVIPPSPSTAPGVDPQDASKVAAWLAESQAPVIVAGTGAYLAGCAEALAAFAETAKIPVFMNGMGRGMIAPHHPMACHEGRGKALAQADLVICLGVDFDFRMAFGNGIGRPDAKVVQVEPDRSRIGRNKPVTLGVCADPAQFLHAVLACSSTFARTSVREASAVCLRAQGRPWETSGADAPIHPRDMVKVVSDFLDKDAIVIGDGGDIVALFAGYHRVHAPGAWMDPGPFGCLGIGQPFAIAARLAHPQKQVLLLSGDGAFGFNAMELDSAVRHKLPFVAVIGNDAAWGEMRTFHDDIFGAHDPRAQYLSPHTRYDLLAQSLGGYGERVTRLRDLRPALQRAFDAGVPAVVDVQLDGAYRRPADTISGKHVAAAFGGGDPEAFRRGASPPPPPAPKRAAPEDR
ncbi:MAG: thiamine pyrophosphate-binding protein [Massilia sp.]